MTQFSALDDLIKYCSTVLADPKVPGLREIKVEDAETRLQFHQLELDDFLETENVPRFRHGYFEYFNADFDPYLDPYSSPSFQYGQSIFNSNYQQGKQSPQDFHEYLHKPEHVFNSLEQEQQRRRNEEIAAMMSPLKKIQVREHLFGEI